MATGTGDLAIMATKMLHPKHVVGVDLSTNMLSFAAQKVKKQNLHEIIDFHEGDAENLTLADNRFDAATVAFGVRNFGDLEKGLTEMRRVLKPGGKLVVLEFTKPRIFPFKQIYHTYFRFILPTIGKITSKDPKAYKYLYESVQAFPDYERFTKVLQKVGFQQTDFKALSLGICAIYTGIK
jgi:demethylmenaquinone methyltransferase/2-methoxy-6-polyprenyl-1,4-benzoquinol methylase